MLKELKAQEISDLQAAMDKKEERIKEIDASSDAHSEALEDKEKALVQKSNEAEELVAKFAESAQALEEANERFKALEAEQNDRTESEMKEIREEADLQVKSAEERVKEAEGRVKVAEGMVQEAEEKLKEQLEEALEADAISSKEIERLETRCSYLEKANPQLSNQLNRAAELISNQDTHLEQIVDEKGELFEITDMLMAELERTKQQLSYAQMANGLPPEAMYKNLLPDGLSDSSIRLSMIADGSTSDYESPVSSISSAPVSQWKVGEVTTWIQSLGNMYDVLETFENEGVDGEMLLELDHEVLEEIGIVNEDYRTRILSNLKALVISQSAKTPTISKEGSIHVKTTSASASAITESDVLDFFNHNGGEQIQRDVKVLFRAISGRNKKISLAQLRKGLRRFIPNKREESARQKLIKIVRPEDIEKTFQLYIDEVSETTI